MSKTLDEIAIKYGTDKSSLNHNYTKLYDGLLSGIRHLPIKLLEIGVENGCSVKMWEEYFPNGEIYGVDVTETCSQYATDRIKIFIGNQCDGEFLESIVAEAGGSFDVIIDDGGHWMHQQIGTLNILWPHVKRKGLYIVEDLETSYASEYDGGFRKPNTAVEFLKALVDDVNLQGDKEDLVTDIESLHFYNNISVLFKQ
jgi:hypothetical protein